MVLEAGGEQPSSVVSSNPQGLLFVSAEAVWPALVLALSGRTAPVRSGGLSQSEHTGKALFPSELGALNLV